MQRAWIAAYALPLVLSCAQMRADRELYEWNKAVRYLQASSGTTFGRCFEGMTNHVPTFEYEPALDVPGRYYPQIHTIRYSEEKSIFHESLHSLIHYAPRDCLVHAVIYGAVKSDRLEKRLEIERRWKRQ